MDKAFFTVWLCNVPRCTFSPTALTATVLVLCCYLKSVVHFFLHTCIFRCWFIIGLPQLQCSLFSYYSYCDECNTYWNIPSSLIDGLKLAEYEEYFLMDILQMSTLDKNFRSYYFCGHSLLWSRLNHHCATLHITSPIMLCMQKKVHRQVYI